MVINIEPQDRNGGAIEVSDIFERLYWDMSIKQLHEHLKIIESVFGVDPDDKWLENELKKDVQAVINQRQFMKENYSLRKALVPK